MQELFEAALKRIEDDGQHRRPEHWLDEVECQPEKGDGYRPEEDEKPGSLDSPLLHRVSEG
jgi:hypothetical protein